MDRKAEEQAFLCLCARFVGKVLKGLNTWRLSTSEVVLLQMKRLCGVSVSDSTLLSGVRELIFREEERGRNSPWKELCNPCPKEWYQLPT